MEELEEELIEIENYYENYRKDLVTKIAYLIGVKDEIMFSPDIFNQESLNEIINSIDAKKIRMLSTLRNDFLRNLKEITMRRNNLESIESMNDLVNVSYIKELRKSGIEVINVNQTLYMHIALINQHILDNIDKIRDFIPNWVRYEYVRNIFLMPKCYLGTKSSINQSQAKKIQSEINNIKIKIARNINFFPFQCYINWDESKIKPYYGNVLFNDLKFLKLLYAHFNDNFRAEGYVVDATIVDKNLIYEFVEKSSNIVILVDCENVDPYRFGSVFKNLEEENLRKIKKVILYDDINSTDAWDYIANIINLPIEHNEIERVLDNKSLVDISMTTGACKEFYKNNIDNMILASSDSDFWGLISGLPDVNFFVLNESDKTSNIIIDKLDKENINHCFIDSFAQESIQEFKNQVLFKKLMDKINSFNQTGVLPTVNAKELVDMIFLECRIVGSFNQVEAEKEIFYNKYIKKHLRLNIIDDKFVLEIALGY